MTAASAAGPMPPRDKAGVRRSLVSHGLINGCLKVGDVASLVLAGLVASHIAPGLTLPQSLLLSLVALLPFRLISGNRRAYRWDRYAWLLWEAVDVAVGLAAGVASTLLVLAIFGQAGADPEWAMAWFVTAFAGTIGVRLAVRSAASILRRRGVLTQKVAIVGSGSEGIAVVEQLTRNERRNTYEIIGIFDERTERREEKIHGIPVTRGIDRLIEFSRTMAIDVVVVALPVNARERISDLMKRLSSIPADILLLMEINRLGLKEVRLRNVGGYSFLQMTRRPLVGSLVLFKVIEDYVVATIGILLTAPIMLVAALLIRLDGPGPILFRQRRVGFNHREFDMLKFRSMAVNPADDGSKGTSANDPRITRIGRFIRRTSIDELPQLFNVLQGHMSVVGPRAHVPGMLVEDQIYTQAVIEYAARHRVKPGITGWAQINGMRGGIHTEAKARRSVELDLEYIENWSIWLDIVIMARTVLGGLWGRNVF